MNNKNTRPLICLLLFLAFANTPITYAQRLTQTVRGRIVDKNIQTPLVGATIVLMDSSPLKGATTDADGYFRIENVSIGRRSFKISYLGYKEVVLTNINITVGKEEVLSVSMEENIEQIKETVITARLKRNQSLNELSIISTKAISVEESQKYAASFNDPGRAVSSVAGVTSTNDGGNNISIRGNSPNGVLWKLEGIDIPSPNHFAQVGMSGGAISIVSSQLLNNFDFLTGAFAAEYGNALSGVFDLKLRKGNNEKREHTFQAGFLGIDLASEGPFRKGKYAGSYLVNYRYSTLGLLSKLGVDVGDDVSSFQDLSFNIYLPTKRYGNFELFGLGGLSSDVLDAKKDSSTFKYEYNRFSDNYVSNTGVIGLSHSIILGKNTYLKSIVSASGVQIDLTEKRLDNAYNNILVGKMINHQTKENVTVVLNHKFDSRLSLRSGFIVTNNQFHLGLNLQNDTTKVLEEQLNTKDNMLHAQLFAQFQYRLTNQLTFNVGAHSMYLALNGKQTFEPRATMKWDLLPNNSVSFGYGFHSQLQTTSVYFTQFADESGRLSQPNKNMDFSKAHHYVMGYEHSFGRAFNLKTELYYQHLFNIPVEADQFSTFSMINNTSPAVYKKLENAGTGKNYGAEITLEKFLSNGYYGILTTSLYNSTYKGSDGIERNTRYNGQVTSTLTVGKEIKVSEKRTVGINIKTIVAGGNWDTPIDIQKSQQYQTTYYKENEAFSVQNPTFFRSDLKLSLITNKGKTTRTLSLDVQNVTNHQNVFGKRYDAERNELITRYQMGLLPILSYKINF
jgi:hypothetical protein